MLRKTQLTYRGINQDLSSSKIDQKFYFDAENIRILATESNTTGSISNDKGTELSFIIDQGYTIIGHATIRNYLVLFTTNNINDIIYRVDLETNVKFELFNGNLNFSTDHYIETEVYYESEDVMKVYWVDGNNQLRHINIAVNSTYTADKAKLFDIVPEVDFSPIELVSVDYGGTHTAGMIQYAYNLISKGGSQSALSPLTELYPLNAQNRGGKLNEAIGKIHNLKISNVDLKYDIIRLYGIKYTSYNQQPTIYLIAEESISSDVFTYSDDGRNIGTLTSDELLFLGGIPIIPSAIVTKYNRLILGNITESFFDIDIDTYDTRAYRFPANSTTTKIKNKDASYESITTSSTIDIEHDCITEYEILSTKYLYKSGSTTYGATGKNIIVEVEQRSLTNPRNVLKSNEIYRIGIEFYNKYGQNTAPKWIADIKIPNGNLNGLYNTLKVTLRNTSLLTDAGVIGWRILRVDRTEQDKTILCQGIVNPSIFQDYKNKTVAYATTAAGITAANMGWEKLPSPFIRNFDALLDTYSSGGLSPHINRISHGRPIDNPIVPAATSEWPYPELLKKKYDDSVHNTYEDTRMFQFYSPDILFTEPKLSEGLKFKIVGSISNTISDCGEWCKQYFTEDSYKYNVITGIIANELRSSGVISLFEKGKVAGSSVIEGKAEPNQNALLGPAGGQTKRMNKYHYWRKYNFNAFSTTATEKTILGTPSIIGSGDSSKTYNATITNVESKYRFSNHLYSVMTDNNPGDADRTDDLLISINSIGAKCMNIVENSESTLESILGSAGVSGSNTAVVDIYRTLDNQYNGNTFEARSTNSYLRIGNYNRISTTSVQIDSSGDTFIGQYKFMRIIPNTTTILDHRYLILSEIVEFPVETSIDINNRSDYSVDGWDAHFQPTFDEYHNYNRVYSQQPIFNSTTATPFTFVEQKSFNNRLLATKVKITGQLVDSWTDVLINEELYVDGNYGGITKLIKNNDLVACFQENAVSALMIQPRLQTVATDGTSIELGRGAILYDYKYITTTSGGTNKLCIFKSPSSIYYIDVVNRSINRISSDGISGISDINGLHSFIYNNVDDSMSYANNIVGSFDQITNDAYFTTPGFTIAFNEQTGSFTSRYSFKPDRYFSTYKGLYSNKINTTYNAPAVWRHNVGDYGKYYGATYDSWIQLLVSPEPDIDCILNNIEYKSEVSDSGTDLPTVTLYKIRAWNDYQDSGTVTLTSGSNIKRKYRDWNTFIPRVFGSPLQRIRNPWSFVRLDFSNYNNYKLILHDIIIGYEAIYRK